MQNRWSINYDGPSFDTWVVWDESLPKSPPHRVRIVAAFQKDPEGSQNKVSINMEMGTPDAMGRSSWRPVTPQAHDEALLILVEEMIIRGL
jgi:hypothetical protein